MYEDIKSELEESGILKKEVVFTAPLHIKEQVKIKKGEIKVSIKWDVLERFFRFIKSLLSHKVAEEVGAKYVTTSEGYFGVENKQLVSLELPKINEETEILAINTLVSISSTKGTDDIKTCASGNSCLRVETT